MPASVQHEGLIRLFEDRTSLAAECLRDLLGVSLPRFRGIEVAKIQIAQVVAADRAPDLLLVLKNRAGKALRVIIVEVQRTVDRRKERSWALYISALAAKWKCGVLLLVVAVRENIARWAKGPFPTGHPNFTLEPLVIGPSELQPLTDAAEVKAQPPELAVLTCIAHARKKPPKAAAELAKQTLDGCQHLDPDRFSIYSELIVASLSHAARAILEILMASGPFEYRTFIKKYIDQGKAAGEAKALLAVLEARHLPIRDEVRERILTCADLSLLDRWIRRAVTIASVDELFAE